VIIAAQGLELLSTVLRSRGNEFDADVMMRFCPFCGCKVHFFNMCCRRAASIMMAFGLDSSKKETEGLLCDFWGVDQRIFLIVN
jgi:hypothetical protein